MSPGNRMSSRTGEGDSVPSSYLSTPSPAAFQSVTTQTAPFPVAILLGEFLSAMVIATAPVSGLIRERPRSPVPMIHTDSPSAATPTGLASTEVAATASPV